MLCGFQSSLKSFSSPFFFLGVINITIWIVVKLHGGLCDGLDLCQSEAEAEAKFKAYTGLYLNEYYTEDGYLSGDADEDADGSNILIFEDYNLVKS